MLLIECPWCGPRDEPEFHCGGEAHIARPQNPDRVSDADWAAYQFLRTNPKGLHFERWCHSAGCRRWFNMARDTTDNTIHAIYPMGSKPPRIGAAKTRPKAPGK